LPHAAREPPPNSTLYLRPFWTNLSKDNYDQDKISFFTEFSRRYRKELFEGGTFDQRNNTIKNHGQKFTLRLLQKLAKRTTVTLMCHWRRFG
jgi:hypothetical protein